MEQEEIARRQYGEYGQPIKPTFGQKLKRFLGPIGVVFIVIAKFFAKLKFLILPLLKYFPILLKSGGSMVVAIWAYALFWGVWFAVGFVLLILVHECGHLLAAKRLGLKVGAPVFIPFMGAFIALKEAPPNAWVESQVGIGGPILGAVGAGVCYLIFLMGGSPLFCALAYTGFFLNLFNLAPVGFLDGGRIATALSPWLWPIGFAILVFLLIAQGTFNPVVIFLLIVSLPRLLFLFRKKSEAELRYFEVTPAQRWTMAAMYLGLVVLLIIGMHVSHIPHDTLVSDGN